MLNNVKTDNLDKEIQKVLVRLERVRTNSNHPENASELETLEREIVSETDKLAALLIGRRVQNALDDEEMKKNSQELANNHPKPMKNNGNKDVQIKPLRGGTVTIKATYYCRKGKVGKKKRNGLYAGLVLLGIHDRVTPGLASEASMLSVISGSLNEAQQVLKEFGLKLDTKTLRDITYRYAQHARMALNNASLKFTENVAGCRVVVSTDGGRIRIRKNKRGPKTSKRRSYYYTDWREPKLLNIYVVDKEGKKVKDIMPFIDGTMKGPDAIFMMLRYYLSRLGISKADTLLIVADGARWIWNRTADLITDLGIEVEKVFELVDFYHAVEHLAKVASLCKSWKSNERKYWIVRQRKFLKKGKTEQVINAIQSLCRGRNSAKMRRERNYFIHNKYRMNYAGIGQMKLPLGSGAMESAVRRVINLRLKGAGIFWNKENAEAIILLRSFYKAGRWNMLKRLVFSNNLNSSEVTN